MNEDETSIDYWVQFSKIKQDLKKIYEISIHDDYSFDELISKIIELIKKGEYPNIILVSKYQLKELRDANGDMDKIEEIKLNATKLLSASNIDDVIALSTSPSYNLVCFLKITFFKYLLRIGFIIFILGFFQY